MVFKKMLGAFGVGGPSVDTVLSHPVGRPGEPLTGQVNLVGGSHESAIEHITLSLVTRMEIEGGHGDSQATGEFHRVAVSGPMKLGEGEHRSIPFQLVLPWEAPVTAVYGQPLHGMVMGVRTEVSIAKAVDKGDLDAIAIEPLPVQQRILDAFAQLGFVFKSADLEYGQISGVQQTLPFYQEIEYFPAPQYAQSINEVELTFVANPHGIEVILEFDKRGGMFSGGHDSYGRYSVAHSDADTVDWAQQVDGWMRQALGHGQAMPGYGYGGQPQPGYGVQPGYGDQPGYGYGGQPGYGGHPGYADHGSHHGGHGNRGPGMAGVAAGVVGGMAAGYVAGEVFDEVFDDEGDEGGEED